MRKFVLPLLALLGAGVAFVALWNGQSESPRSSPFAEPAQAPFQAYVSASGLIESPTTNLAVATPVSGIVKHVYVQVGQQVRAGEPLFQLDDAARRAEMARQQTALELAEKRLRKLELGTRPEEIATQEAQLAQARGALEDARRQLELRRMVADTRAISRDEVLQQEANVRAKEQQLNLALRQLELLKAGSWQPDIEIAKTEAAAAKDEIAQIRVELDRLIVRAPVSGEILQINVQPGELASLNESGLPPVMLGETRRLHVRAEVDENDAWRVDHTKPALAFPRGRRNISIPLRFVRLEPYIRPKKNLTGESTERVDTRVLAVIYELQDSPLRLFVGQQLDVYIEAEPLPGRPDVALAEKERGL